MHRRIVARIDDLGAIAQRRGESIGGNRANEPNPAKMAVERGRMGDERTQPCQNGDASGGWIGRKATNEATETTARGEMGANEPMAPPVRRGIGANEPIEVARRRIGANEANRGISVWDDPCIYGVELGTRLVSMHAVEDGAPADKKTPGGTIVWREERIHPAPSFQPFAALTPERTILAPSFEGWPTRLAAEMEGGRYTYDPDERLVESDDEDDADGA